MSAKDEAERFMRETFAGRVPERRLSGCTNNLKWVGRNVVLSPKERRALVDHYQAVEKEEHSCSVCNARPVCQYHPNHAVPNDG